MLCGPSGTTRFSHDALASALCLFTFFTSSNESNRPSCCIICIILQSKSTGYTPYKNDACLVRVSMLLSFKVFMIDQHPISVPEA